MPEAAEALGKTVMTFKKWIKTDLIPAPIYTDTSHRYLQYSVEEVEAIAEALSGHFDTYDYLHHKHTDTVARIASNFKKLRNR